MEKYADKINWKDISIRQKLSEEFMEKHADKINWKNISQYQKLSTKFIEKFKNKISIPKIKNNENTPKNYDISKILHIDIALNDEIRNIKKFKNINLLFV
jgi:hypothetical protein